MANSYDLKIYALNSAQTSVAGLITQSPSGAQWDWDSWETPTLTTGTNPQNVTATINNSDQSDTTLDDDSTHQTLSQDITLNGVTYHAGTQIQDEYEVTLTDEDGKEYRMVAISARHYYSPDSYDDRIIGYTWEGDTPPEGTVLTYAYGNSADYQSLVPCFTPGIAMATPDGPRPIEALRPGDLVITADHGAQPLCWIGERRLDLQVLRAAPWLVPVRICAGALGPGRPARDLLLSPQHRVLVRSAIAQRIGGQPEILVAAKHLCGLPGIALARDLSEVTYMHLMLERHEILFAEGAEMKSLFVGKMMRRALAPAQRQELMALFPTLFEQEARTPAAARLILSGRLGRKLQARHFKHGRPLQPPEQMPRRGAHLPPSGKTAPKSNTDEAQAPTPYRHPSRA